MAKTYIFGHKNQIRMQFHQQIMADFEKQTGNTDAQAPLRRSRTRNTTCFRLFQHYSTRPLNDDLTIKCNIG